MNQHEYMEYLISLAKEVESEDGIDWGMLNMDEDTVYRVVAASIVQDFNNINRDIMMASILKLLVENFVLNYQLRKKTNGSN